MADITIKYNSSTVATINSTQTEVLDTSGKYLEDDIKIEYVKPTPNLQTDKYVTPSTSGETIRPDAGYEGLAHVYVNPISPQKTAQTYTPTTADQTISSGRWLVGDQTIKGDANLTAGNIKKNVSIFGVLGDYEGYTAKQVLEGTAAFLSGTYVDNETTTLASGAYAFNSKIQNVTFSSCTSIGKSTFYFCPSLTTASFPACTSIGTDAFYSCTSLTTISFPACISIGTSAFSNCTGLTLASFPACTTIGSDAFAHSYQLTTALFPACTSIGSNAFYQCNGLTTMSFPACTAIGSSAFYYCYKLSEVLFPACSRIYPSAFQNCLSLTTASFPACIYIGVGAFSGCTSLTTARFDVSSTTSLTVYSSAFYRCFNLLSLYILGERLAVLSNVNAFTSTPISTYTTSTGGVNGSIFVRASLLTAYQSAARWSTYSSRFVGLTDAEIAALG